MDALLHARYFKLTHSHLKTLPRLFQKLTGLKLCLAWAPRWPLRWKPRDLPTHSFLCRQRPGQEAAARARCERCGTHHLARTLKSVCTGHSFTCPWGVRNFWFPIIVQHCPIGIAFVQVLAAAAHPVSEVRPASPRSLQPAAICRRPARVGLRASPGSREEFAQATRLVRLIFEHVQTSALADLRQEELTKAQQAVRELQTEAARLRENLNGLVPAFHRTAPTLQEDNRAEGIVRAVLKRMQRDYARPIRLVDYARDMRLNPAYLSALFSRSVGLSFKTFHTELRMERARELLSNPARNISEVAGAVGYASENCFRLAFKRATGLSPKVWRETLRIEPLASAP